MSAVHCTDCPEAGQRLIGLITLVPAKVLLPVVSRFLHTAGAYRTTMMDINRDKSTGVDAYEWLVAVRLDERDPIDVAREIIGDEFLDRYAPITETTEMITGSTFLRIGSIEQGKPPTLDELFIIKRIDEKNGEQLGERQLQSTEAYERYHVLQALNSGREDIAADNLLVGKIAKKYKIDGGSWLLYPDFKFKPTKEQIRHQCMVAFTKLVTEFLQGTLQDDFITRVNYATIKEVVKVTNEKTNYFEFVERQDPPTMEERFSADTQVKSVFLKMVNLQLKNTRLKYKPEIFSVWKLNTDKTRAMLSIYNTILFDKKKELASA